MVHSAEVTPNHNQTIREVYRDHEAMNEGLPLHHLLNNAHYTQITANQEIGTSFPPFF